MSEIRIGATEPAPDSPAFAVSRDSSGILIGVRDKAAPQFAVSRDAEGILLSAWPAKPPNPSSYVASGYILALSTPTQYLLAVRYYRADGRVISGTETVMTSSSTEWQRFSNTIPVDPDVNPAYVSVRIDGPWEAPTKAAYLTAMQLEAGTTPTPYEVGGKNLLLNPEFATGVDHWWANPLAQYPLSHFYSHAPSLPSSPLPGVTTAIKFTPGGWEGAVWWPAIHDFIALPT